MNEEEEATSIYANLDSVKFPNYDEVTVNFGKPVIPPNYDQVKINYGKPLIQPNNGKKHLILQPRSRLYKRLLNKPYVNEVTLRGQKKPLKSW